MENMASIAHLWNWSEIFKNRVEKTVWVSTITSHNRATAIDFQKSPSSCLFMTSSLAQPLWSLKQRSLLCLLGYSTLKLMRSTCGKSTTATMTKHFKSFSNLNKCSLCFWDQKGMSQCFRSPMKPFSCANAFIEIIQENNVTSGLQETQKSG